MIVVIGGGPAGRMASMRLASAGKEVTLLDYRSRGLGGQCLFHGCMVINAFNDVATGISRMQELAALGVIDRVPTVSYHSLISRIEEIQNIITEILTSETEQAGVIVRHGSARVDGNRVFLDDEEIPAEAIIIATGSVPSIPPEYRTDISGVYTPHTITTLNVLPKHLTIIGSGVIAAEYAYIYRTLGVQVDMIARSSLFKSLPHSEREEILSDLDGIRLYEETTVIGIEGTGSVSGVRVVRSGRQDLIPSDCVLLATGLVPNTDMITGIQLDKNGAIRVDAAMQTSLPGIYAAGDVTGPPYQTPVARRQGIIAADSILGKNPPPLPPVVPYVIRLKHEHGFASTPARKTRSVTIPSPAGPGTFWSVPSRHTGKASMGVDENNRICSIYEASSCAGAVAAYYALLMNSTVSLEDIAAGIEVHPSADGLTWIARYLIETRKKD